MQLDIVVLFILILCNISVEEFGMLIFIEIRDIFRFAFSVLFNLLPFLPDVPLFLGVFTLLCIFYSNLPYLFGMHIFCIHGLVDFIMFIIISLK